MKRTIGLLLSGILLISLSADASNQNRIRKQITTLVVNLSTAYKAGQDIVVKKNVAIGDFENSGELAKKNRIGETIRELMTAEFSRSAIFNVIERKDLVQVLKEQELQMSGLTDPAAAARTGALLNADLILTGSVSQTGADFTISAKLVSVESGQVYAETVTVAKKDMLETVENTRDMAYVQKMGVGISINVPDFTFKEDENLFYLQPFGAEVKYRFSKNLMIGVGIEKISANVWHSGGLFWTNVITAKSGTDPFTIEAQGYSIPVNLYLNFNLSRRFNVFISASAAFNQVNFSGLFNPSNGNGFGLNEFGPILDSYVYPSFSGMLGFEFFLNPRVALSVKGGYAFRQSELTLRPMWHIPALLALDPLTVDMSGPCVASALSFYF